MENQGISNNETNNCEMTTIEDNDPEDSAAAAASRRDAAEEMLHLLHSTEANQPSKEKFPSLLSSNPEQTHEKSNKALKTSGRSTKSKKKKRKHRSHEREKSPVVDEEDEEGEEEEEERRDDEGIGWTAQPPPPVIGLPPLLPEIAPPPLQQEATTQGYILIPVQYMQPANTREQQQFELYKRAQIPQLQQMMPQVIPMGRTAAQLPVYQSQMQPQLMIHQPQVTHQITAFPQGMQPVQISQTLQPVPFPQAIQGGAQITPQGAVYQVSQPINTWQNPPNQYQTLLPPSRILPGNVISQPMVQQPQPSRPWQPPSNARVAPLASWNHPSQKPPPPPPAMGTAAMAWQTPPPPGMGSIMARPPVVIPPVATSSTSLLPPAPIMSGHESRSAYPIPPPPLPPQHRMMLPTGEMMMNTGGGNLHAVGIPGPPNKRMRPYDPDSNDHYNGEEEDDEEVSDNEDVEGHDESDKKEGCETKEGKETDNEQQVVREAEKKKEVIQKKLHSTPLLRRGETFKPQRRFDDEGNILVTDTDILLGRGHITNNHKGNRRFRDIVALYRPDYIRAHKVQKPAVARVVVRAIRNGNPPGRFLRKDEKTGHWVDVGDKKAAEKTSQALRERIV